MKRILLTIFMFFTSIAHAASMFERDEQKSSSGTSLTDEVAIPPLFLVQKFGQPSPGDGIRVSGNFTFKSKEGIVFTIYDYKSTTLWATDEGLPTPAKFWQSSKPQELSIGSKEPNASDFKKWLLEEYQAWLRSHRK